MAKRLVETQPRAPRAIRPGSGNTRILGLPIPVVVVAVIGLIVAGSLVMYSRREQPEVIGDFGGQAGIANTPITSVGADPATAVRVDAPETVVASSGDGLGSIRVDWTAPESGVPLDGYRVSFLSSGGGVPTEVALPPESNGLTQYGLEAGVYRVSVAAVSASIVSTGTFQDGIVATGLPTAPVAVSAVPGDVPESILVRWDPPLADGGKPVDWYTITYTPSGAKAGKPINTSVKGDERSRLENGLPAGNYVVSVVALTQIGSGPASAPVEAQSLAPAPGDVGPVDPLAGAPSTLPPPSAPRNLAASIGPGGLSIKVSWEPPKSGIPKDGYRVFFLKSGAKTPLTVPLEVDRQTLVQYGFDAGSYEVSIAAVTDAKVGTVARLAAAIVLTGPKPGEADPGAPPVVEAPQSVVAVSGDGLGSIRVDWKHPISGAPLDGYRVTFTPATGAPIVVPMAPDALGLTQFDLAPGEYGVSVVAVSQSVVGPAGTAAGKVVATGLPGAPQAFSAVPGGPEPGTLTMDWQPPAATGGKPVDWYTITYTPVGGDGRKVISTSVKGDQNRLVEVGLPVGAYQVTIVALTQIGTGPASAPVAVSVQ